MNQYQWVNPHQPQTLYMATILCYIDAVFGLLPGFGIIAKSVLIALFVIAGLGAGGWGIANEKKWGYALAVAAAVVQVGALIGVVGLGGVLTNMGVLISWLRSHGK